MLRRRLIQQLTNKTFILVRAIHLVRLRLSLGILEIRSLKACSQVFQQIQFLV